MLSASSQVSTLKNEERRNVAIPLGFKSYLLTTLYIYITQGAQVQRGTILFVAD
jgi:hypothetical protein